MNSNFLYNYTTKLQTTTTNKSVSFKLSYIKKIQMAYQLLKDLELGEKTDWKIRIRLLRKWKEKNNDRNLLQAKHMIVADENVSHQFKLILFTSSTSNI